MSKATPGAQEANMEFTVSRNDLVRELSLCMGGIDKRSAIPILSHVLVEAANGTLRLKTTDLETVLRCSCHARVKNQGAVAIPARRLLAYVRRLPDADIDVAAGDDNSIRVTSGCASARIEGMAAAIFPQTPEAPRENATSIPAGLLSSMIAKTIFAISAEESRFTLNGALLILKNSGLMMVVTDGHRLVMTEAALNLPEMTTSYRALLPCKAMSEILKLTKDNDRRASVDFYSDNNFLFFGFCQRSLLIRTTGSTFPDFEKVLAQKHSASVLADRDALFGVIDRVMQFSDERSRAIRVRFADGEIKIQSSLYGTGESEESVPVEYSGETVEIGFNADYLLDFLRAIPEKKVEFHFKDAHSAGELRPVSDGAAGNYRYLVMPLRIS